MGVQRRPGGGWQLTIGRSPLDVRYIYAPSAGRPLPSARAGRLIFDFGGGLTVSLVQRSIISYSFILPTKTASGILN